MTKTQGKVRDLDYIFDSVREDMNREIKALGHKSLLRRDFKRIVKRYFKHLFDRIVYNYESVELWRALGVIHGHKILCTRYNPYRFDVNKTDGYYYFYFWESPKRYIETRFKPNSKWKKLIFQNVLSGGDYPEITEDMYKI